MMRKISFLLPLLLSEVLLAQTGSVVPLQAATALPAEFLGKTADFGTVEVGTVADLVLLDADPLESISHTRKIAP